MFYWNNVKKQNSMETEKTMSSEESILLIRRMIHTAKEELEDSSFYYLLWGWLVFTACVIHFILIKISFQMEGIGWMILMPLGVIISSIYGYRQGKKQRIYSYISDIIMYVLIAFIVSLFIVLFFWKKLGLATYPMVMLIYGIWLFVSGGALKFRPLIIGGIINWTLAITALFFEFEQQLIILAIAVLLGYIIPGHMLRLKYRKGMPE